MSSQHRDDGNSYADRLAASSKSNENHCCQIISRPTIASWSNNAMNFREAVMKNESSKNIDGEFASDIQIQRLTAQLTAAYNRIASLEEQLISKRIKS